MWQQSKYRVREKWKYKREGGRGNRREEWAELRKYNEPLQSSSFLPFLSFLFRSFTPLFSLLLLLGRLLLVVFPSHPAGHPTFTPSSSGLLNGTFLLTHAIWQYNNSSIPFCCPESLILPDIFSCFCFLSHFWSGFFFGQVSLSVHSLFLVILNDAYNRGRKQVFLLG